MNDRQAKKARPRPGAATPERGPARLRRRLHERGRLRRHPPRRQTQQPHAGIVRAGLEPAPREPPRHGGPLRRMHDHRGLPRRRAGTDERPAMRPAPRPARRADDAHRGPRAGPAEDAPAHRHVNRRRADLPHLRERPAPRGERQNDDAGNRRRQQLRRPASRASGQGATSGEEESGSERSGHTVGAGGKDRTKLPGTGADTHLQGLGRSKKYYLTGAVGEGKVEIFCGGWAVVRPPLRVWGRPRSF